MSWEDSRANCLGYGADLVSVLTSWESDFIYQQIGARGAKNYGFWIGLFRNKTTGDWIWSDGNNFTNPWLWGDGQPNNHNDNESCAVMNTHGYGWHDYNCAILFFSVCKRRKGRLICVVFFCIIPKFSIVKPFCVNRTKQFLPLFLIREF